MNKKDEDKRREEEINIAFFALTVIDFGPDHTPGKGLKIGDVIAKISTAAKKVAKSVGTFVHPVNEKAYA